MFARKLNLDAQIIIVKHTKLLEQNWGDTFAIPAELKVSLNIFFSNFQVEFECKWLNYYG